jgi:methyl-accepting chemotaxis protein
MPSARRRSIRWWLPLSFALVLLLVASAFTALTYREVRLAALDGASDRLTDASTQVATLLQASIPNRLTALKAVAEDTSVVAYLAGTGDEAAAIARLTRLPRPGLWSVTELRDASGSVLLHLPDSLPAGQVWMPVDSAAITPFVAADSAMLYAVVTPVRRDGTVIGYLVDQRRISSSTNEVQLITDLIGSDATVLVGNKSGDAWTDLGRVVDGPPAAVLTAASPAGYVSSRGDRIGVSAPVEQTPWAVWVEFPREAVMARAETFLNQTILIALALVAFGALVGSLISRRITSPLGKMTGAVAAFGEGKEDVELPVEATGEIGELANAFDEMIRKLSEREKTLHATSDRLAYAAAEILAATTQQASGETEATTAVAHTMTTVEEVIETANQSRDRADLVAKSAQRAADIGKAGQRAVEESMAAMSSIRGEVESIAERIVALAEQAQAIGEITAALNDIAEQTNLLALNAAVEAARAGEHGRGFAVVAGEVKALAQESRKATVQVRRILGEIQRATGAAVMVTEQGTKHVLATARQVTEAGSTIQALIDAVGAAAHATHQIVASAGQQTSGMKQIRFAMESIQRTTQQNLAATRQAEQAAHDLNALGKELAGLVNGGRRRGKGNLKAGGAGAANTTVQMHDSHAAD